MFSSYLSTTFPKINTLEKIKAFFTTFTLQLIAVMALTVPAKSAILFGNDPHSFAQPDKARARYLNLDVTVDFSNKTIQGKAAWDISSLPGTTEIIFDTHYLNIEKVTAGKEEAEWSFTLGKEDKYLGNALHIPLRDKTNTYTIYFSTTDKSSALQWLDPQQTAGKKLPFLFTQCQAILARTLYPCQDSPGIRFSYDATVTVPPNMLAVMSAGNPTEKNTTGVYHFEMKQPIPSYLMALAVGDMEYKSIGDRTGVYAEPSVLPKAVYEFADMQKMLETAEQLYGPYQWEQYDVLVLPPSFPFGGMENPRLTFATPTVLAGDRSLVSLVAHELAHSWSGNLVTNATWNDFWLNEGFTVYFERRIDEALYGKSFADMESLLGYQDLLMTIKDLGEKKEATQLKLNLKGKDPDDGMNSIAYEKGFCFLKLVEKTVGREKLDTFLKGYFHTYQFQSVTTEKFIDYFTENMVEPNKEKFSSINIHQWVYEPGLPADCPKFTSERFNHVDEQLNKWLSGTPAKDIDTSKWATQEWLRFMYSLPEKMTLVQMEELDHTFHFTQTGNAEIADAWFLHCIKHNYSAAYASMDNFLVNVGRRKFLTPLYKEMIKTKDGKKLAESIYTKARLNYHFVSQQTMDELLKWKEK